MRQRLVLWTIVCVVASGCGLTGDEVSIIDGERHDEGRSLQLWVSTCNVSGHRASVDERDDEVVVRIRVRGRRPQGVQHTCADGVTVELERPLGGRALVDASTGERVEVR